MTAIRVCVTTCVALVAIVTYGSSNAAADDLCGATVVDNLRLDEDLTCSGNGLLVGADGIRINLNGHTIAGSGSGIGISVAGRSGVSIGGGTIQNFQTGVLMLNSTAVVVKDLHLIHNGDGVDVQAGSAGNTIKASHFQNNLARGIMMRGATSANVVKDNTFDGNRVGILLFGAVSSTVKDNTVASSGLAGIRVNVIATDNLIQENTVVSNPAGIDFIITPTGSSLGNTLRENTIALNTCGIKGPTSGNTLTENVFEGNASDTCS